MFRDHEVQAQVIEVGLGGLLDSTNVFEKKDVAVITNIGLEHREILGDTVAEIARQKAGIIVRGLPDGHGAAARVGGGRDPGGRS